MDTRSEAQLLQELAAVRKARDAAEELVDAHRQELALLKSTQDASAIPSYATGKLLLHLKTPALLADSEDNILLLNEELHRLLHLPEDISFYTGMALSFFEQSTLLRHLRPHHEVTNMPGASDEGEFPERMKIERERVPVTVGTAARGAVWLYRDATAKREQQPEPTLQEEYPHPMLRISFSGEIQYMNGASVELLGSVTAKRMAGFNRLLLMHIRKLNLPTSPHTASFEFYVSRRYFHSLITSLPDKGYFNIYMSDITERKQTEEALQESRNFTHNIARTIPSMVYINDLETGEHIYSNEQVYTVLGYSREELVAFEGDVFSNIVLPEDLEKMYRHIHSILQAQDGEILEIEYQVRCKNGDIKILRSRESVFKRRQNGSVTQVIGSAEDVTAIRHHSQELISQKEFYESILNNIPSDVAVFNEKLQYVFLNPAAIGDGTLRKWLIGKTNEEYSAYRQFKNRYLDSRLESLKRIRKTLQLEQFEEKLIDRQGKERTYIRYLNPVLDEAGDLKLVIGHGLNITELKRAQTIISASEAKNRAILAAIPDIMFIIDKDGHLVEMNNVDQKYLPIPKEEVVGKNIMSLFPYRLATAMLQHVQRAIETGISEKTEYDLNAPEGTLYYEGRFVKYSESEALVIVRDTTEEKKAALETKAKNDFIELVLDSSPSLIYVKDGEGNFVLANHEFAKLFGRTIEEIEGLNTADIYPNKKESRLYMESDREVIRENKEIKLQERFTNSQGEIIWFSTTKKPLVTADGQVHVLGISTNVTEQRQASRQLEHSEELHRLLSENSRDLISLHNPDGSYIYASKAVEEILGYSQIEMLFMETFRVIHPDDRERVRQKGFVVAMQKKTNVTLQCRLLHKNGNELWVETNLKPILDTAGNVTKIQSATRDITNRKRSEEALRHSEKKYRDLINYSQAYICTHDMEGNIQSVNPYLLQMLGLTTEKMVGKNLSSFFSSSFLPYMEGYLQKFGDRNVVDGVLFVKNKDQEKRSLHYQNYKVEEPGAAPYIIAIAQDITDRMRTEVQLTKAKEAAEESARVKENFLANMSHEIRTPMNGILGMAGLLKKTTLDSAQQNLLQIIQQSADNLLVVINDILDIAKIEAGKMEIEQIPFDLAESIRAAYKTFIYKAEEKEINYVLEPINLPHAIMLGDPYRLNQVLLNLLNNAIKFTEEGTVRLACHVLAETAENLTVEITVSDTGIGIPASKIDVIFDGFTQAYSSTTRKYGGTGLGLNISKTLVEMQQGTLTVESQEENGSTFKVHITYLKSMDAAPKVKEEVIDFTSLSHIHLLMAEDNEVNIFLAQSIVEGWGARIDIARNGVEAVELARQNTYDIILMDIQMPELSGIDATMQIRKLEDKAKANVPIIALTANALKGDAEKYIGAGMNDYISKPFEEEKLFMKIAALTTPQAPARSVSLAYTDTARTHASQEGPLYDLSLLQKMSRGNQQFLNRTQELFIQTVPLTVEDLHQKHAASDWTGVSAAAHKLKSTIDTMQISTLKEVVRKVESDAKQGINLNRIGDAILLIDEVLQKVILQLQANITVN
ncbi:PAS domain S-box protein [Pontibacter sp. E15-1]|uniref:PAS domain S-box protein n=1 Tax=Pontibacter sp. E15-1 TaxID=2919918 RepID=UPI001F4FD61D|nr:PAS domain S-box protein [Pontibacter sp. E15-1]MCJ8166316.1 PAS domain S-box protein [Pontibacter sp. E15-1]